MKTLQQASKEYAEKTDKANAQWVAEDFEAGVKFAQTWISVEEEMPTIDHCEKRTQFLTKGYFEINSKKGDMHYITTRLSSIVDRVYFETPSFFTVTHWRMIEIK